MLKKLSISISLMILLSSCMSVKVSSKNNFDFGVLEQGKKYAIEDVNKNSYRPFRFESQDDRKLKGFIDDKGIEIDKSKITQIKQLDMNKTLLLSGGIILGGILVHQLTQSLAKEVFSDATNVIPK